MTIDDNKLNSLLGKFVTDFGAALHAATVIIGEKLGLYKALASAGVPLAARELAEHTGTTERYVAEWLAAQAASGYIEYDGPTGKYSMTREQALVLADDSSPTY